MVTDFTFITLVTDFTCPKVVNVSPFLQRWIKTIVTDFTFPAWVNDVTCPEVVSNFTFPAVMDKNNDNWFYLSRIGEWCYLSWSAEWFRLSCSDG